MIRGQRNAGFGTELKRATSWTFHHVFADPGSYATREVIASTLKNDWPVALEEMFEHYFMLEDGYEGGYRCTCRGEQAAFRAACTAQYGHFGREMVAAGYGVTVSAQAEAMNALGECVALLVLPPVCYTVERAASLTLSPAWVSQAILFMNKGSNPSEALFRVMTLLVQVRSTCAPGCAAAGGG